MKKYNVIFLFLVLLFCSFSVQAQKTTIKKELDSHVTFLSEVNTQVQKLGYELKQRESFRVFKNDTTYYRSNFHSPLDLFIFDKLYAAIPIKNSVLGTHFTSLKNVKEQTKLGFEKIAERTKALEVYYKIKKHEQDNFNEYHLILDSIFKLFDTHTEFNYEYQSELENLSQKKLVNTSFLITIDKLLRENILEEKKALQPFMFSYFPLTAHTNPFPLIEVVDKSYLNTEKLLQNLEKQYYSINKSNIRFKIERLISNLKHHQKYKMKIINQDELHITNDDTEANHALSRLNYALNTLIADYKSFLEETPKYGFYNFSVPINLMPYKTSKKNEKTAVYFSYYKNMPYQSCNCFSSSESWTKQEFEAFSTYMYFLEEVKESYKKFYHKTSLNHSYSKEKIESIYRYSVTQDILPKESYLKVKLYNDALPENCQKSLLPQVENIYSLAEEIYSIYRKVNNNEKFGITIDSLDSMKERFFVLSDSLAAHYLKLRKEVTTSYYAKNIVPKESIWYKSVKPIQDLLLQQRKVSFKLHQQYLLSNTEFPAIDSLRKEYEQFVGFNIDQQREPHKKEIKKTYYDFIEKKTSRIIYELSDPLYNNKMKFKDLFNSTLINYETSIGFYNRFLEELPYQFLPDVSFIALPRRVPAVQKAISLTIPKKEETSKPRLVSSSKKNNAKTIILRDTIYIYQKDTLYLDNSTVDEKFYSLEGYAPNNLVVLIDVSGSMQRADRLPLLKKSLKLFVQNMRTEDEISIVVYSGKAKVMLSPTSGNEKDKILKVIDGLESEGKTNVEKGMKIAYKTANENYKRKGNNKVILVTDGDFEVENSLVKLVQENAQNDIVLSILNYSTENAYNSLNKLIKVGGGYFRHITFANSDVMFMRETKVKK